ncbi:MAG: RNA 2'-phosphotransferase [Pirellulales bacterium]|nr:RNA 2'-phosphotransferase [Pirellulales bacterium]
MSTKDFSTPNRDQKRSERSLIRFLCQALRHTPWQFGIVLDAHGWSDLDKLIFAVQRCRSEWALMTRQQVEHMIACRHRDRLEISEGRIRALYGHSVPDVQTATRGIPPNPLFHGTKACWLNEILTYGLRPMERQLVHLTTDFNYALRVATTTDTTPVVLTVDTERATHDGTEFWKASRHVWQVQSIPAFCVTTTFRPQADAMN